MTITILTLWISILFLYCAMGTWKLFEKAGRKTWEGFIFGSKSLKSLGGGHLFS